DACSRLAYVGAFSQPLPNPTIQQQLGALHKETNRRQMTLHYEFTSGGLRLMRIRGHQICSAFGYGSRAIDLAPILIGPGGIRAVGVRKARRHPPKACCTGG